MNIVILSGKIAQKPISRGANNHVLLFTVAATHPHHEDEKKESVSLVPCVLFNPSPEVQKKLMEEGKGLKVELQGRVNVSRYEVEGETRYSTEVVVYNRTLNIEKSE